MEEVRKVREFMIPLSEYPTVYENATIKDAILTLKNYLAVGKQYRSLLVFSQTRKVEGEEMLVGILTIRDILNAIKKNKMLYDNTELFTMSWTFFYRKEPLKELAITRVSQVIRPLVDAFVQADDRVGKAVELMMTKNVNIVPVFEGKRAVGILRAIDLLDLLASMIRDV